MRGRGFAPAPAPWRLARALALGLALLALPAASRAHDSPYSALNLERLPDGLGMEITIHPVDAASVLGIAEPDSLLRPKVLEREAPRLAAALMARSSYLADGRALAPVFRSSSVRPDGRGVTLELFAPWERVPGRLAVHARFVPEDPQHETFLEVRDGQDVIRQEVLTATRTSVEVFGAGGAGLAAVAAVFIPAGIHHIFTGPDHMLFVIGLLLLGGSLVRLLKIVTGFTIAHSITLALAALGIVNVSSRIVEPLIAVSIVLVGIENLRELPRAGHASRADRRGAIAFGFGFIHGLGFASVLRETGLPREALAASLLSFNLGVEFAQACVVLAVVPVLFLLRSRAPRLAPAVAASGSWLVVLAGSMWFFQRVLGSG
jgi:hypothetical protein